MPEKQTKLADMARSLLRVSEFTVSAEHLMETGHPALLARPAVSGRADIVDDMAASRDLTRVEIVELIALIHYAARLKNIPSLIMRDRFFDAFDIVSLDDLSFEQFAAARAWLQAIITDRAS